MACVAALALHIGVSELRFVPSWIHSMRWLGKLDRQAPVLVFCVHRGLKGKQLVFPPPRHKHIKTFRHTVQTLLHNCKTRNSETGPSCFSPEKWDSDKWCHMTLGPILQKGDQLEHIYIFQDLQFYKSYLMEDPILVVNYGSFLF